MNTPSPLVPQGTTPSKKKSTIRIAFFTILVVHVVFIGGLLIQGCTKDNPPADNAPAKTNADNAMPANGDTAAVPAPTDPTAPATTASTTTTVPAQPTSPVASAPVTPVTTPVATSAPVSTPPVADTAATREYTIQKGDMLGSIARKNGVTVKALQAANPGINALRLQVGQKIQIPAGSTAVASSTSTGSADTAAASDSSTYTVKSGDRLINIAKSHGTTVKAIAALNGLRSVNSLKVGQKLKMPVAKATSTETAPVSAPAATAPAPAVSSTPTTTALAPTGQVNN